jgi:hypothetical protein
MRLPLSLFLLALVNFLFTTHYMMTTDVPSDCLFIEMTKDKEREWPWTIKAKEIFIHLPSMNTVTNYVMQSSFESFYLSGCCCSL